MSTKTEEPTQPPRPIAVMSGRELAARLKVIADRRGMTMAEALDKYAGPAIAREFKRCIDEMQREVGGEG